MIDIGNTILPHGRSKICKVCGKERYQNDIEQHLSQEILLESTKKLNMIYGQKANVQKTQNSFIQIG